MVFRLYLLGGYELGGKGGHFAIAILLTAILSVSFASAGWAGAFTGLSDSKNSATDPPLVEKTHGFHCRPMFGWDPRLGIYHVHRHEGICRDHQRCMRVMYRCNLVMGRGWDTWSYERWGDDNWRFDRCMLDAGCY
jgi:hypothetical protein